MPSDQTRIAVLGAAGYVGRALLSRFERLGWPVTGIARGNSELAVPGTFHEVLTPDAALAAPSFDVVVNLAYPAGAPLWSWPTMNQELVESVERMLRPGGHLVHISSLAVFGLALDQPIVVGPVAQRRDDPYVESKIEAEVGFARLQRSRGLRLDVVRLGNVWGPASPNWAVALTHRLLTGRPVLVDGAPSFSNVTDVDNAASYLAYLATRPAAAGVRYHHMSEFSRVRWDQWASPLAAALGVEPRTAAGVELRPPSARAEVLGSLASLQPRALYQTLSEARSSGSLIRSAIRHLPPPIRERMRADGLVHATQGPVATNDLLFLTIVAGNHEFASSVDQGWAPEKSMEDSVAQVVQWLAWE